MKTRLSRFLFEVTLWNVANVLCMGLATFAVYLVGTSFLDWGTVKLSIFLPLTAVMTSTWGSWSSMVWARTRAVRIGMYVSSGIPGVLMAALGIFGFYMHMGAWLVWAGFILGGAAMLTVNVTLCRRFNPRTHSVPALSTFYGVLVHPVITLVATGGIAAVWYNYLMNPLGSSLRDLISLSTVLTTLMAVALITTVIPAATSTFCRRLARDYGEKMRG